MAFVLPMTLGLACTKRDWNFCSPSAPCKPGYTCSPDWRCLRDVDAGSDGLVAVDSQGQTDAAGGSVDGSAGGSEAAGPADVPAFLPDAPEKVSDVAPIQAGGAGGASGSGGAVATPSSSAGGASGGAGTSTAVGTGAGDVTGGSGGLGAIGGAGAGGTIGGPPDASPADAPPIQPTVDAAGTCSADKDCSTQAPLCLGNRCAKCVGDADCSGRPETPACAVSGLCVACTLNKHCTGGAATCDTATNQCVGCVNRSDCAGACQTCSNGICTAIRSKDDTGFCAGTCDNNGACKSKQGQTCQKTADCVGGMPCADGFCCDKTCTGSCESCDVATSPGICTTLAANATPHASHPPCVARDTTCAGKCSGTSTACYYPPSTIACGTASCSGKSYQAAGTCNNGECDAPGPQTCASTCVLSAGGCSDCTPGATQCSLSGVPQLCLPGGTWQNQSACQTGYACVNGAATTCTMVDCGALLNPTNGTVAVSASTFGSTATYSCSTGYQLSGVATRTCQASGAWSGSAPSCPIVDCGALLNPTNGTVAVSASTFGSTATYSCSTGYQLSGAATRTCQASGAWSGSAPSCVSRCPNGMAFVSGGTYTMAQKPGTVTAPDLCFDVNFVTTAQYNGCTTCTPADSADASTPNEMYCNTGISFRGQDPINCVDWNQADFYCNSVNKRLPAEHEYEWAARSATSATTYPWGNTAPTASDNPEKLCWIAERNGFSAWPARPAGSCPVGSYDVAGRSPLGIKDLVGNVWHWTSTMFDPTGYVVRGGGWDNSDASRVTGGFRNGPIPASTKHYALGIRCVAAPS
jgi:hypothetical protein